jgi:glycosyltransferase involved in cell wall biosynthesis
VSRFTARQIVDRLDVPAERITVCSPGAPSWTPRADPRPDGPVLFVGTLEARKNVGTLLRAYARVRAAHRSAPPLVLVGRPTRDADEWLRIAEQPPLAGFVEFAGYVADERRRALFAHASMLVLPSYHEGFGIPVLEAMASGVPVVVSRRGALPEVAGDAGTLIDPDDEEALAAAILRYLTDPQAAREAAARGVRRAREYSWEASAQTLYDAYVRAIARRRAA